MENATLQRNYFFPALSHPDVSLLTALYTQKVQTLAIYSRVSPLTVNLRQMSDGWNETVGVISLVWWSGHTKLRDSIVGWGPGISDWIFF